MAALGGAEAQEWGEDQLLVVPASSEERDGDVEDFSKGGPLS